MRGLAVLAAVAACTPSGLTIEVRVEDPNITRVEMFLGAFCDNDCPRAAVPPGLVPMPVTHAYVVLDKSPWIVSEEDFRDGMAGFRIESPVDVTVPIVVVVGYVPNANGVDEIRWSFTTHDVAIPDASSAHWQVELLPTTPIATMAAPANSERMAFWQRPSKDLPACLLVEHWTDKPEPIRELIGPMRDTDCDAVTTDECAPWIANATGLAPTLATANCVVNETAGTGSGICRLAGPECTENPLLSRDPCTPLATPYCMPLELCQCSEQPGLTCLQEHIAAATTTSTTLPFLKCSIHVGPDGNACSPTPIVLNGGRYIAGTSTLCTAIRLNDLSDPLGAFGPDLALDAGGKLVLDGFAQPCTINASLHGTAREQTQYGLAELELDNGHHLVVPARIDIKPDCAQTSWCELLTGLDPTYETMFECVTAQAVASCEPAPDDTECQGVRCGNNICCPAGQQCFDGVCGCGNEFNQCMPGDFCVSSVFDGSLCGTICCGKFSSCPQF